MCWRSLGTGCAKVERLREKTVLKRTLEQKSLSIFVEIKAIFDGWEDRIPPTRRNTALTSPDRDRPSRLPSPHICLRTIGKGFLLLLSQQFTD
jgi:hypothetical protein